MAKTRVYELARELKLESKALLEKLRQLGVDVASHQSTLSPAQVGRIRDELTTSAKPKVVVRKRLRKTEEPETGEEVESIQEEEPTIEPVLQVGQVEEHESVSDLGMPEMHPSVAASLPSEEQVGDRPALKESQVSPVDSSIQTGSIDSEGIEPARIVAGPSAPPRKPVIQGPKSQLPLGSEPINLTNFNEPSKVASIDKILEDNLSLDDKKGKLEAEIIRLAAEDAKLLAEARAAARQNKTRTKRERDRSAQGIRRYTSREVQGAELEAPQEGRHQPETRPARHRDVKVSSRTEQYVVDPGQPFPDDAATSRSERGKKGKSRNWDEERIKPVVPAAKKRGAFSLQSLLDSEEEDLASRGRRRTVYAPSGAQKKRDLKRRKDLKTTQITTPRAAYRVVRVNGNTVTVAELAKQLSVKGAILIQKLMSQGVMVSINQEIDFETASLIASEYGYECKNTSRTVEDVLEASQKNLEEFHLEHRPPIVTVMGHVDHGKTSILDAIRRSDVASTETGGITQHIGAYSIIHNGDQFTFLDTPGHAAFSAMRARGAQLTDIVVLVVAADDGVMPQTVEAISHARDAKVPIIVAVNKMDKPNINLDRIYSELSEHGIQSEDWGGDTQFVKMSAINDQGIDELLESIKVQAEILELKARVDGPAEGVVVEAKLDKGRGPVATIMVMQGRLELGRYIVAGSESGRVRGMCDHNRVNVEVALPATPVEVIGLTGVPMAGDKFHVVKDEKVAREVIGLRGERLSRTTKLFSSESNLEEMLKRVASDEVPRVPILLKADTQGSLEAIAEGLSKLNTEAVRNTIVHMAVGGVNESDVILAETSGAVILGFNVRGVRGLLEEAEKRGVTVKFFGIIYELTDAVRHLMAGHLPPVCTEVIQGHAEVREPISVPKVGVIAGSAVIDGKITRSSHLRLLRNEIVVYSGKVSSLRRFKDDVKEVQHGYECGIGIDGYNDIKSGDIIEAYMIEEKAATLEP